MEKQLDRMEQVEKPSLARKRMRLDLELHKWRCEVIIEAINLTKRYADQIIIKDANSHIRWGNMSHWLGQIEAAKPR